MAQIELFPTGTLQQKKDAILHKCSVCKKKFYWNDESKWYGKLMNKKGLQEVGHKVCSTNCLNNSRFKDK